MQHITETGTAMLVDDSAVTSSSIPLEVADLCTSKVLWRPSCVSDETVAQHCLGKKGTGIVEASTVITEVDETQHVPVDDVIGVDGKGVRRSLAEQQRQEEEVTLSMSEEEEEEKVYEQGEYTESKEDWKEEEGEEEEEEEMEECSFEPSCVEEANTGAEKHIFVIQGKKYTTSAILKNPGFEEAQEKLRKNPKAMLTVCSLLKVHNVMKCHHLHLTNRAVLIGDCYVRINMLVDNPARVALLNNPVVAALSTFCDTVNTSDGHDVTTCSALHLLPEIVFVGGPRLKVGYFERELHDNIALRRLREGANACGSWCKNRRSHVVVTCAFVHYKRDNTYTEVPQKPPYPLPLIPSLRPRSNCGKGNRCDISRGRGRGSSGGKGRGNKGSRGARGRGGGALQFCKTKTTTRTASFLGDLMRGSSNTSETEIVAPVSEKRLQAQKERILNIVLVLLGIIVAILAYMLS